MARAGWLDKVLRAWRLGALVLAAALVGVGGWVGWLASTAPDVTSLRQAEAARPSVVLSADGVLLAKFARAQTEPVTLAQVSPHVLEALIATEDHRFRDHAGVDFKRTLAAVWHTANGDTQGGSTITQQLARNLFPREIGRERTVARKLREIATAIRIERLFEKDQILEAYLNSAPFLYNVVGIEMAARTYFDKPAAELDTLEAATLVGMLKGTAYYNPVRHPERALARRNVVLAQMVRRGALAPAQLQTLQALPLGVTFARPPDPADAAPHFVARVRQDVLDWADGAGRDVYTEGLVVHTTLDSRLQALATRAVHEQGRALQAVADVEWSAASIRGGGSLDSYAKRAPKVDAFAHFWARQPALLDEFVAAAPEYAAALAAGAGSPAAALARVRADKAAMQRIRNERSRLEAGFVAIDPASGAVRAWVGSRDFDVDQFDHVAQAARQPGSTFKPFVYAAALEAGMSSHQTLLDTTVAYDLGHGRVWRPTDMGGTSEMPMTLRNGLALSKNTITVQVAQEVGVHRVAELARAMGVRDSTLDVVPSLALGTSPVTLLEMVTAYTTIARQGEYRRAHLVQRIEERDGTLVASFASDLGARVLSTDNAIELTDMLRDAVNRGTGAGIRRRFGIDADVAGKTGTTQDNTDGWFVLMHPQLVAGAWVGFNDQRVTMRSSHWGQGAHNALLVVGDFFRSALRDELIDAKAAFPASRKPLPPVEVLPSEASLPADAGWIDVGATPALATVAPAPMVHAVASAPGSGGAVYGDRAGTAALARSDASRPMAAHELERALAGMASAVPSAREAHDLVAPPPRAAARAASAASAPAAPAVRIVTTLSPPVADAPPQATELAAD